jgi:putative hemolysin
MDNMPGDPFDLNLPTDTPLRRAAAVAARPLLHWALRLNALGELYDRAIAPLASASHDGKRDPRAFAAATLGALEVRTTCDAEPATDVPVRGPLIVAANHPHGALDGLVLLDVIGHVRPDVRLVANHLLARIPELRALCFFVDPFERHESTQRSLAGARAAHLWLREGGALIVFPAGEVGHERRPDGSVVDSRWRSTVGRLALSTGARVVPAYIDGVNSRLFYLAGRIHPLLRTVLLPRELLNSRGRSVFIRLGHALSATQLAADRRTADKVTERIRDAVEQIRLGSSITKQYRTERPRPLASPIDPAGLAEDVRQLPVESKLVTSGAFDVHCAEAAQIPHVLGEIGRLRERSFRAVGEGTGNPSDLDTFDTRYLHLFVWNRHSREVVGAYRIGRADLIVASAGVQGLYTRTLFRYDEALFDRLPPALELGRSFVRPEYQRGHNALLLLWKGICAFVQRHPRYRVLLGAVSISARYTDRTREMLMRFLEQNHLDQQLAELVSSLRPDSASRRQNPNPLAGGVPRTIEEAHAVACQFERDGRGMPVLLRQYLKLNARVLGFSVDPSFGDVLDALMMVVLLQVDARILRRYFGTAGVRTFLEHHLSTSHAA